ncbi:hypothetical protein SODALDRAFT_374880 [Sodiomyces alkalinus F11]|uniref:Uncharacterized protein n=1 Tax=Sodiomyces alkalinus (strain CBS 110278 / VKM F-3762 / F11) TaxID=1314773 RepID=A0A3N2Q709_SODAK|nr:hypothetical protein SODALDRAFT_374880 [Sodiomyces alkalinus F11]ROT42571.1 hypothetical protein SODALDRAFT_374880 [Sodiomyces alkalinus F11]
MPAFKSTPRQHPWAAKSTQSLDNLSPQWPFSWSRFSFLSAYWPSCLSVSLVWSRVWSWWMPRDLEFGLLLWQYWKSGHGCASGFIPDRSDVLRRAKLGRTSSGLAALFLWGYWWGMGGIELDAPVIIDTTRVKPLPKPGTDLKPTQAQAQAQAQPADNGSKAQEGPKKKFWNRKGRVMDGRRNASVEIQSWQDTMVSSLSLSLLRFLPSYLVQELQRIRFTFKNPEQVDVGCGFSCILSPSSTSHSGCSELSSGQSETGDKGQGMTEAADQSRETAQAAVDYLTRLAYLGRTGGRNETENGYHHGMRYTHWDLLDMAFRRNAKILVFSRFKSVSWFDQGRHACRDMTESVYIVMGDDGHSNC